MYTSLFGGLIISIAAMFIRVSGCFGLGGLCLE